MSGENLRVALETAAAGGFAFPAIVTWNESTKKLDKRPAISGWREAATRNPEQIKQWWTTFPDAVPGVELGRSNLFVVDLDRHPGGADGVANFKAFRGDNPVPRCPTTKTPSGGYHLYFRQPEGERLGNRTGTLPAGIDCRGDGGWTVAPGAVFEQWRWVGDPAKLATASLVPRGLCRLSKPARPLNTAQACHRAMPASASAPTPKRHLPMLQTRLRQASAAVAIPNSTLPRSAWER